MRIISIIDSIDLYGKERANIQVANILRKYDFELTVLVNTDAKKDLLKELASFNTFRMPFPRNITASKYRIWQYIKRYIQTLNEFRKILKEIKPDYILIPTEIALSYLLLPLLFTKIKIIFRCGDSPLIFRKKGIVCRVYSFIWRYIILRRIDIIVCISKFISEQIIKSGRKDSGKDIIIYNYPPERSLIDCSDITPSKDGFIKVGCIGRIVPEKGIFELVQAVIELNEEDYKIEAYIAGNTNIDESYFSKITAYINMHKAYMRNIHFLGNINDVKSFYNQIDFLSIPSIYQEPLSNVVVEAKIYHKLSIIFNVGGIPELINHKKNGYVCKDISVSSLKEGILYYYNNRHEIIKQGEDAYKSMEYLGITKEVFERKWLGIFH